MTIGVAGEQSAKWAGWRPLIVGLALPLVLFFSTLANYALTADRSSVSTDAYAASVGAWRIATTGKPWLDGLDVTRIGPSRDVVRSMWLTEAPNGHVVPQRMLGPILAGVPFYWLFGHDADPSDFSLVAAGLAAATWSALAVVLIFMAVRRNVSTQQALTASLIFAFATPTWSVSADALWTHTVTQFGLAASAFALSRARWWLAGVGFGIAMLGRPHVAVIAAFVGLGVALSRRRARPMIGLAIPTIVSLGCIEIWNRIVFGQWSIGGAYGDGRITQAAEGLPAGSGSGQWANYLGFFVSPDRGFLIWSPIILVVLPALICSWRELPDWSRLLVIGGLVYTFFQLRLNYFAGGDTFYAYRHGLELLTCLLPAIAFSMARMGTLARLLAPPLVAIQVAMLSIGAISGGFFLPVEKAWTDNSFWLALRDQPSVVGTWLFICLAAGTAVSVVVHGRSVARAPVSDDPLGSDAT